MNSVYAGISGGTGNHTCRTHTCNTGPTSDGHFLRPLGRLKTVDQYKAALALLENGNKTQKAIAMSYFNDYGMKPWRVLFFFLYFPIHTFCKGFVLEIPHFDFQNCQMDR